MAMGLGALYMLHLLAQDWNVIRQPLPPVVQRLFTSASSGLNQFIVSRAKRDTVNNTDPQNKNFTIERLVAPLLHNKTATTIINWKRILSGDPLQCLPSLLCQLAAGTGLSYNEGFVLYRYVWNNFRNLPLQIRLPFIQGLALSANEKSAVPCYETYPLCWYSAKTMLKILSWLRYNPPPIIFP